MPGLDRPIDLNKAYQLGRECAECSKPLQQIYRPGSTSDAEYRRGFHEKRFVMQGQREEYLRQQMLRQRLRQMTQNPTETEARKNFLDEVDALATTEAQMGTIRNSVQLATLMEDVKVRFQPKYPAAPPFANLQISLDDVKHIYKSTYLNTISMMAATEAGRQHARHAINIANGNAILIKQYSETPLAVISAFALDYYRIYLRYHLWLVERGFAGMRAT